MFEPEPAYDAQLENGEGIFDAEDTVAPKATLSAVEEGELESVGDDDHPDDEPPKPRGRPTLRVVK